MKRRVANALCLLTMCSLCILELILVMIFIRQHVLYDYVMCMSEEGKSQCLMLGAIAVLVRFSFFRLLERIGFCCLDSGDAGNNYEMADNVEFSYVSYGALLNLINPLSVVCIAGIFDAEHMHYFWMLTPFWVCGVVLLGKKRRMAGLQLTTLRSADRLASRQRSRVLDCVAHCRSLTGRDLLSILLTAGLAVIVGQMAYDGVRECCESPGGNGAMQSQVERLSLSEIKRKVPLAMRQKLVSPPIGHNATSWIKTAGKIIPEVRVAELVSDSNQLMDALLACPDIPSDYGAEMIALYRDRAQDVYTRDFAVQHIGLYAEALNRRGTYDPASREAGELRRALWDASGETSTIVAAAAFRALADLAGFEPKINARRLDSRLVSCAGDASASSAARVMAVQLCGERGIAASRPLLQRIFADAATPVPLKKAAEWSLRALDGKVVAQ